MKRCSSNKCSPYSLSKGSFILYVRSIKGRSLLFILILHSFRLWYCCISSISISYGWNVAIPLEILGAVSDGVAYSSSKTSKTRWRRIFWKNGGTSWGKAVLVGAELQTDLWCYLAGTDNSNRTAWKEEIRWGLNEYGLQNYSCIYVKPPKYFSYVLQTWRYLLISHFFNMCKSKNLRNLMLNFFFFLI